MGLHNLVNGVFYVDDVILKIAKGYEVWEFLKGLTGPLTGDNDGDGRNNLYEYALNGDPVGAGDAGVTPVVSLASNILRFVHLKRNDDTNLSYIVETRTNLLSGAWTNAGYSATTNVRGGGTYYDVITNNIPTTNVQSFIRLKISKQ